MFRISDGCNLFHPSSLLLSHGAIVPASKIDEANSGSPVYVADRIVPAVTHGGCNDFAFLGTVPDSRVDGYARWFRGKAMGCGE